MHFQQFVKCDIIAGLRRAGLQLQRRKIQDREQSRKIRDNSLYSIKETEPLMPLIKHKSSFLHYCCNTCTPASRVSFCYEDQIHITSIIYHPQRDARTFSGRTMPRVFFTNLARRAISRVGVQKTP